MRTTIKDVAKLAGVSPTTVSFVINNKPVSLSDETRIKVKNAIKALGYRPNQLAVGLVTNTTNTVGLILPDSTNPFFAVLAHYIEIALRQEGIAVIIGNTEGDPEITRKYLNIFSDRCLDGIILAQLDFDNESETVKCQELIQTLDTPIVFVDRITHDQKTSSIQVDQQEIGYLATKHLLSLGHTRIGCVSGSIGLNVNARRYEGYQRALREHGIEPDERLLFCDSLSIECGCRALPYLLGQNVTAIFTFNDMIAYGIYKESRNYNLTIPTDLSVVGVDDIQFSDILYPPLTTVAQPVEAIAQCAVRHMLQLIDNRHAVVAPVKLCPVLKVRGSTKSI